MLPESPDSLIPKHQTLFILSKLTLFHTSKVLLSITNNTSIQANEYWASNRRRAGHGRRIGLFHLKLVFFFFFSRGTRQRGKKEVVETGVVEIRATVLSYRIEPSFVYYSYSYSDGLSSIFDSFPPIPTMFWIWPVSLSRIQFEYKTFIRCDDLIYKSNIVRHRWEKGKTQPE